ncbi:MAG: hypothetical protein OFPII_42330 [Osedax symbiont Rs1]|nr:MAG: hypothetical protein OFPII_42330 [Osedax symbiont Rs1]
MRVCGIELKGAEAIICLLDYQQGAFTIPDCRTRQFTVSNSAAAESVRDFQFSVKKLIEDYKIEQLVIVERMQKGKFAGSSTSFKLEAALQLIDLPVTLMTTTQIKEWIKRNPLDVAVTELGLKKFQQAAFSVAYAHQNKDLYSHADDAE